MSLLLADVISFHVKSLSGTSLVDFFSASGVLIDSPLLADARMLMAKFAGSDDELACSEHPSRVKYHRGQYRLSLSRFMAYEEGWRDVPEGITMDLLMFGNLITGVDGASAGRCHCKAPVPT